MLLAGCTGCRACAQICPDFVFQVYKYDTPLELARNIVQEAS
jgi:2-oxoglutarate ferredoxin oxidoreductase subunit delta